MPRQGLLGRTVDLMESRLGVTVERAERVQALEESATALQNFAEEASDLGYMALDMLGGRPHEMRPEKRARLAARSRTALREDPLAKAEATLLANFSFGRGVAKPQCVSDKVQEIVDEAWDDPVNQEKLTGFAAQRHRSNELLTGANLYPTAFTRKGRVRLAFLDPDLIIDVITDEEDDELPLWYVGRRRRTKWNFKEHRYDITDELKDGGLPKVVYYKHWRHVEDAEREAEADGRTFDTPDAADLRPGLVNHVRINRIGRTQFGTPPWAATLRFFSAMNQLTEAHVAMAQARSTWIAKRVVRGGPSSVAAAANNVISQTGQLSASRFFATRRDPDATTTQGQDPPNSERFPAAPPMPGSLWVENEQDRLENLNISSGAGEAATTAQIVRAPIAAAAGFGQHYLGDASNANLATATSLELPALMHVEAWQQMFQGDVFGWFIDLVIQEAVRAGRLGGRAERLPLAECETEAERKPLDRLVLTEALDKAEMERRTGEDLSYTFEMPYPGRRNLPDVTSAVQVIAAGYDPAGVNVPLRRKLLYFFARDGLGADDPARWVDDVIPEDALALPGASALPAQQSGGALPPVLTPGEPGPGGVPVGPGPSGGAVPSDALSRYGERTGVPQGPSGGVQEAFLPPDLREPLARMEADLDVMWKNVLEDPAVSAAIAASAPAAQNGRH